VCSWLKEKKNHAGSPDTVVAHSRVTASKKRRGSVTSTAQKQLSHLITEKKTVTEQPQKKSFVSPFIDRKN
jgi:hypothetical protein